MDKQKRTEIGRRAANAIMRRAGDENTTLSRQFNLIDTHYQYLYRWMRGGMPGADVLANMAESGYDIHYILTGREAS